MLWRWGGQIAAQVIAWGSTLAVVRLLSPGDYGLFAMSQVIVAAFTIFNGYSFATSLIREEDVTEHKIRQILGMLILFNGVIALLQFAIAPYAAAYYRQPTVEAMLQVQALIFLTTPFIALPIALFQRQLDFKSQAYVNMLSAVVAAISALSLAWYGMGVWALVLAPIGGFIVRAIGFAILSRMPLIPIFDFRGAGKMASFGGALTFGQLCWITQSQSDVLIAGRLLDPHSLGLYTEALFLTLIITGRFIPPINEVAYPAYAELHKAGKSLDAFFLRTARSVLMVCAPLYFGLALTAEPAVLTLFGEKWRELTPFVQSLATIMPAMALQIICAPATNAMGSTRIYMSTSVTGAIVFPTAFWMSVSGWWGAGGAAGLTHAWWIAVPIYLGVTLALTLPAIGVSLWRLARECMPIAAACSGMAAAVTLCDSLGVVTHPAARLGVLTLCGGLSYAAILWLVAPGLVRDSWAMLRGGQSRHQPASNPH